VDGELGLKEGGSGPRRGRRQARPAHGGERGDGCEQESTTLVLILGVVTGGRLIFYFSGRQCRRSQNVTGMCATGYDFGLSGRDALSVPKIANPNKYEHQRRSK
jgi:hypothetical protein